MRLIDADRLINVLDRNSIFRKVTNSEGKNTIEIIKDQPTIEAVPVVHGEWVKDKVGIYHCSACNEEAYWDTDYGQQLFEHCPYCGAKVDGGKE